MDPSEAKAKYYVRLFEKYEYLQEFCSGYFYMNNIRAFSKYDDDLIYDVTEGKVINQTDRATLSLDGKTVGYNISIPIQSWYILCLFELFAFDVETNGIHINVRGEKFGQFVTSYIGDKEKCFISIIDADTFDAAVTSHLTGKLHYQYKSVEFVEYNPANRMESYLKGDTSLLFQKRPKYLNRLSEKRLCIYYPSTQEDKDFIRIEIKEIVDTILFAGIINKDMVQRQNISHQND